MSIFYNLFYIFNILLFIIAKPISSFYTILLKLLKYDEKFAFLSEDEKSRLTESTDHEEPLDQEEKEMIRSIFELGDTTVNEIMVPRIDIKALDISTNYRTALATIREAGHSRIPVYKENIDSIVGILYAKDILGWISINPDAIPESQWDLESLMKTPQFVPSNKKIDDLMNELKKNHIHMAIVVDEYGGTAGIVTMEDILEEIVGEIQDEYDSEEEPVKKIGENTYLVKPHIELDDLADILDITIDHEDEEYNTLSGLFYHEYGDVPKENTEFEFNGIRLKILKMNNQRIEKLELKILRDSDNPVDIEKEF
jgi:CBS domain containing-hemolysin-like protein